MVPTPRGDEGGKAALFTREESPTKRPMGQSGMRKRNREGGEGRREKRVTPGFLTKPESG